MKPHILPGAKLSSITLRLSIEGETWEGFPAQKQVSRTYQPADWPGLKRAIAAMCKWDDCRQETVRPFYGQLHHTLHNEHEHYQYICKELPRLECEPLQGRVAA